MLKLVNTLLDAYKFDAENDLLNKELVNIKKLAQDCIVELTPLAMKNNQNLINNIAKKLPFKS
ncbi:MAG: cell wall metabolism sensor histidine kinase WalK [Ignavibacteriales bacterium]|nr:cell wall metabolism sensor histidine kinase WalK [Ignavibacteriales bacterium]